MYNVFASYSLSLSQVGYFYSEQVSRDLQTFACSDATGVCYGIWLHGLRKPDDAQTVWDSESVFGKKPKIFAAAVVETSLRILRESELFMIKKT